jgi:hypothetical protein
MPKEVAPSADELWRQWMVALHENAISARVAGRKIFIIRLEVQRNLAGWTNSESRAQEGTDVSGAVQTIEDAGWTLFDTGYVFVPTREQSHVLTQSANIAGSIVGIFTFRVAPNPPPPPPAPME